MEKLKGISRTAGNVYNRADQKDQKRRPDYGGPIKRHEGYADMTKSIYSPYEIPSEIEKMIEEELIETVGRFIERLN